MWKCPMCYARATGDYCEKCGAAKPKGVITVIKQYLILAILIFIIPGCSSAPKASEPVQVIPQTVNNSSTINYGDVEPACIMRGDFTYCRTCYQYDGMRRQSCYWTRAQ